MCIRLTWSAISLHILLITTRLTMVRRWWCIRVTLIRQVTILNSICLNKFHSSIRSARITRPTCRITRSPAITLIHTLTRIPTWEVPRLITTAQVQTRIQILTDILPTICHRAIKDRVQSIYLILTGIWACMDTIMPILPAPWGKGRKVIVVKTKASRTLELILIHSITRIRTHITAFLVILLIQCDHRMSRHLSFMEQARHPPLWELHQLRPVSYQIKIRLLHNLNTRPFYKSN